MQNATQTINSPSFFDATQFGVTGNDPCQQILATFNAGGFPKTGGTVDARGLVPPGVTNPTLNCSVNPIPSNAKGRLLLSSGTYLAQVPWVIQSNDVNIIGTGGGIDTGNNTNTTLRACTTGLSGCAAVVFPPGHAVIEVGTPGSQLFQVTVKELNVDCNDALGVSGFAVIAAQEETVLDQLRATGCRVAGFDIGIGDNAVQNGAALSNFQVKYPGGAGCPNVVQGTISSISRNTSTGVVSVTLSAAPTPPLADGYEVVISGVPLGTATFNGTYRVNPGSTSTTFTYNQASLASDSASSGNVALYPVGVRVWQKSGSPVRPIINGTINGSGCPQTALSQPTIAMELSGGFPFVHNIHTEGFGVGIQLGDLSGTSGATLSNIRPTTNTTTGVVISDQWKTSGGTPQALPTGSINIFNLDVTPGSGTPTANSIIDNINGNTLTNPTNGTVSYYMFGGNGVMTSASPEAGLTKAVDINNQTLAIYSGSANAAFSAAPSGVSASGVSTGALTSAHYLGSQTTGPTCGFTSGGGSSPSCSVDTGSTDSVGTIIATTGATPSGTGTITLTFNSSLGANRPSCVFSASDKGSGAWNALAVMKDNAPTVGSDKFTWTNGTTPTPLSSNKTYWINYFCGGR